MLTEGYGLTDDKIVHVGNVYSEIILFFLDDMLVSQLTKKIEGKETSWALGAAYHLLNTYHEPMATGLNWSEVKLAGVIPQLYHQCVDMLKGICEILCGKVHDSLVKLGDLVSLIH